jgi:hypothetical protein
MRDPSESNNNNNNEMVPQDDMMEAIGGVPADSPDGVEPSTPVDSAADEEDEDEDEERQNVSIGKKLWNFLTT